METKTPIPVKSLPGIRVHMIEVAGGEKATEIYVHEISGKMLIRVGDLMRYLGETRGSLSNHFAQGRLKRYHPNGMEKTDGTPHAVFVDLRQWLALDKSEGYATAKILPRVCKIKDPRGWRQ